MTGLVSESAKYTCALCHDGCTWDAVRLNDGNSDGYVQETGGKRRPPIYMRYSISSYPFPPDQWIAPSIDCLGEAVLHSSLSLLRDKDCKDCQGEEEIH